MNIVVVGAGAVGGYFGGRLAQAGAPVTFLVREGRYRQLSQSGLQVRSVHGDFTVHPKLARSAEEVEGAPEVVIVAVKNYHLEGVLTAVQALAQRGASVLPLLNGVEHMAVLRDAVGEEALWGGVCYIEATLDEAGRVVHTSPMHDMIFGPAAASDAAQQRAEALANTLREAGVNAFVSRDIWADMWQKYIFLTALSAITAGARKPIGDVLADPVTRPFLEDMVREIVAIARTQRSNLPEDTAEQVLQRMHAAAPAMTSSMHRDLEKGMPLELDSLQGALLRTAEQAGVAAPCLRAVYALLHPHKDGRRG
ncbi:MAG: ketopantoate reductase family protein [Thermoflavifilum sp.]|nr:ketopantoate reductase family protein [Thermoflavifilum sp.]MCL6514690.1 ketopantoate reductase family protein [Alicyclobacillus sp.]